MGYHDRSHWDAVHAGAGDPPGRAALEVARSAVRALDVAPGAVVVDVACGDGPFLGALPGETTRVGVDLALGALRAGTGVCGDALALPLRDGVADAVVLLSSWWALPDPGRGVAEAARVLRPGGRLLVHTWDRPAECRLITLGASCVARVLPAMVRPAGVRGAFDASPADVAAVLRRAGLRPVGSHRGAHTWPLGSTADYWAEFRRLAPTSYAAYRDAPARARADVDRLLGRLLDRLRADGVDGLGLSWRLTAAGPITRAATRGRTAPPPRRAAGWSGTPAPAPPSR